MSDNDKGREILYHPRWAIEHVQTIQGLTPVRLFAVLFPLWYVEVAGRQEQSRPYELLEKYIERGIDEGQLHTVGALGDFFGLDSRLVEKILDFLETIGHVTHTNNIWDLTNLGKKSVAAGKKIIPKETRQRLYFDAFRFQPLLREHYGNNLQIFSDVEADSVTQLYKGGYQFQRLLSFQLWNAAAIGELERRPDRALYNLREEIHDLQSLEKVSVYMPMYIVETGKRMGQFSRTYYVVYTHIQGRHDEFFERIVNTYPEIQRALSAEKALKTDHVWAKWLASKGIEQMQPVQLASGVWQIILPREVFRSTFSVAEIGTYRLDQGYFLQIWCNDVELRRDAALDRTLKIIKRRRKFITSRDVDEQLQRFAEQLYTRKLEFADLRRRAEETGMRDLLRTIDAL